MAKHDRYLDSYCTRKQTLTAIENLLAMHVERFHTPIHVKAWGRITRGYKRLIAELRRARNA